jgi:hypothetical protein
MGAGSLAVRTASGRQVTVATPMATVRRSDQTVISTTGSGITITGLRIEGVNNSAVALRCSGCSGVIAGNVIAANVAGDGVGILLDLNASNTVIRDNTIMVSGGVDAWGIAINDATNVTVTGNTISATGGPVTQTLRLGNVDIAPGSTGNVRLAGDCSVTGTVTGTISFTNFASCP